MLEERRSASLRTTTFCELLVLDAAALEELKAEFPEFKDVLRRVASERSGKLADLVLEGITL
jgi:CRP-like cAMP-binding protein